MFTFMFWPYLHLWHWEIREVACGLAYLHELEPPVFHRDVKGVRMLFSSLDVFDQYIIICTGKHLSRR